MYRYYRAISKTDIFYISCCNKILAKERDLIYEVLFEQLEKWSIDKDIKKMIYQMISNNKYYTYHQA